MRLKSYFSGTVEAAMERARRELGDTALLVNARPSTPDTRPLGEFEVVFGVIDEKRESPEGEGALAGSRPNARSSGQALETASSSAGSLSAGSSSAGSLSAGSSSSSSACSPAGDRPAEERLMQEVAEEVAGLRRELERFGRALGRPRLLPANGSEAAGIYARLVEAEFEPALAERAAQGTPLEDLFEVDATLGRRRANPDPGAAPGEDRAVVALIGPPGAGKTTTLVKLAARYGLAARRPAQILTIDVCRIAAADQLRTFAAILGIGFAAVETPTALAQAIEEYAHKDFIFIDTPGYGSAEREEARELARLFAAHPLIDTHLVVAASMKPADLRRTLDRYEMFSPHKLIFTRMDETETCGALLSESARRGWPVSFVADGQNIPDDLEPATKTDLAARLSGPRAHSAGAAA